MYNKRKCTELAPLWQALNPIKPYILTPLCILQTLELTLNIYLCEIFAQYYLNLKFSNYLIDVLVFLKIQRLQCYTA